MTTSATITRSALLWGTAAVLAVGVALHLGAGTTAGDGHELVSAGPDDHPGHPPAAPATSIVVHGDWRIAVYGDDGERLATRQFSNLLVDSGRSVLATLLAGESEVSGWQLTAGGATSPCGSEPLPTADCVMHDAAYTGPDAAFETLSTSSEGDVLVLAGTFVAPRAGDITTVGTQVQVCSGDEGAGCTTEGFTRRAGLEPVSVLGGQTVELEVRISFE